PTGRAIGVTIIALFCLALGWAAFGKIDIVASAPGKIIASGRTKTIQPFETGVVRAIHVRDGMAVKAGDRLIELDPTMNLAERNHIQSDLTAAQLDIARLTAALSEGDDPVANFHPPEGASPELIAMHRRFLISQMAEHRAKVAALDKQRAQKEAERSTTAATVTKLEATIPVVQQRADIRGALYNREFGSKLQYLETLQLLIEQQQDLGVQKSKLQESEAAVAALVETRAQTVAEFRRTLLDELNKAEAKAAGLVHDMAKAEQRARFQTLTAPVDGVVQQLAVHTVGGVVTPAQALLVLVPQESQLEIEAMVSNRDIGFVHPGQEAEIKVDTFTFTRYGLLYGKVLSVSQDAITKDKPQDKQNDKGVAGADNQSSEPKGQEMSYAARISLDRTQMQIDDNLVNLGMGMAVTVEVKTGERSVLSYLLSPILKYKHEMLRER
ncbi:MAG: HlyD family type I secretion periplasmic adaptor subunit, partial [Xanthobacteraceae bacterium]